MAELTIEEAAREIVSKAVDHGGELDPGVKFTVHAPTDRFRVPIQNGKYQQLRNLVVHIGHGAGVALVKTEGPAFTFSMMSPALASV